MSSEKRATGALGRRASWSASTTAAATARAATAPSSGTSQGRARAPVAAGRRTVTVPAASPLRAAANSAALAKRSAGSLDSAVRTASSTAGGTLRRWADRPAGSALITLATMACAVGPVNGGSPTSIS